MLYENMDEETKRKLTELYIQESNFKERRKKVILGTLVVMYTIVVVVTNLKK